MLPTTVSERMANLRLDHVFPFLSTLRMCHWGKRRSNMSEEFFPTMNHEHSGVGRRIFAFDTHVALRGVQGNRGFGCMIVDVSIRESEFNDFIRLWLFQAGKNKLSFALLTFQGCLLGAQPIGRVAPAPEPCCRDALRSKSLTSLPTCSGCA